MLLQSLKQIYSLDTLDTRFTRFSQPSSSATPKGGNRAGASDGASAPLWRTREFYFYYFCFITLVPLMFKTVYDVSKPSHPNYSNYEPLLDPGWIPGRKVDNSDAQYSNIRENLPYMLVLLVLHPLLRRAVDAVLPLPPSAKGSALSRSAEADARLNRRASFDFYFGLFYIVVLHGSSALKVLLILYTNYCIAKRLPREYVPAVTWIFNIGILFANEIYRGYPYAAIADLLFPWNSGNGKDNWGSLLDGWAGLISRWEILFNITVLRLISFNMDYYWSLGREGSSPIEKKQLDPSNLSERDRVDIPAQHQDYSFRNYLAYVLYSPLYLTGPILTFNDYICQLRYTPKSITTERTTLYGIRFFICLLAMEVILHFIYAVAISKAQPAWEVYTPFQLSMLGYFNLHIIWLKLLLPWRFFRLWALIDGIDPPENMVRCMSDNYSTLAFWRNWHRSFNRWIIRYIYIPLGGSGHPGATGMWAKVRSVANLLAVFTFVALWHDINLRLLMWGWLITLFVLPEVLAEFAFPENKWRDQKTAYRVICGIGGVGNVLMMMVANLIGFAVGLDGIQGLVNGIVGSYSGLVFLAAACGALFVGVQVMFEIREEELRHGIKMRC